MKSPNIGDEVPTFSLKSYDAKEYDLKQLLKENKIHCPHVHVD